MDMSAKTRNNLLIIGPLPDLHGIGGVTVHVQRLLGFLEHQGFPYSFLDYKGIRPLALLKAFKKADVVHIHISNPVFMFALVVLSRLLGKTTLCTFHGNYGRYDALKNFLVRISLRLSSVPIVINQYSYSKCKRFNKRLLLIPAFIPPQKEEILPDEIVSLVERIRENNKTIFSTNAYNITIDKEGNEIYGIDFLVHYFEDSADKALIVSDPSGNYQKRYSELESSSVFFIGYPHPYYELLKRVDFFVRNTSTDGDALSVKEALYLGLPTLCTDVVDRPEGARLFKYCDAESFENAVNNPSAGVASIENGAIRLLELYKSLI